MTLWGHLRAGWSVSQRQKVCYTCAEACDPVGYAATREVAPPVSEEISTHKGGLSKPPLKDQLSSFYNWNFSSKPPVLLGDVFYHWAAVGQSQNGPVTFANLLEQSGLQLTGLGLCLQTCRRESTFLDVHWSFTNPKEPFHQNHFGQCGWYEGLSCVQFIFCLLKDNTKKDTRVLTTDMVLKCKYSRLSRRGELMSLKEIISACQ